MDEWGGGPTDLSQFHNLGGSSPRPPAPGRQQDSGHISNHTPFNLEAERSVLGAILVRNDIVDTVRETGLQQDDFFKEAHQKIYEVIGQLNERRDAIDLVTLSDALRARGWLDEVGGPTFLAQLLEDNFATGNATHYAKIVREKAVLRKMISTCSDIISSAHGGVADIDKFLDEAESQVFGVSNVQLETKISPIKNVLMANMERIEELALQKADVTGISTGFVKIDELTTGLHPGQIVIIAARPGMGKTSWFLSALQHTALEEKKVCALFSLEMTKEELGFRFLSGLSRIESRKLRTGKLLDRDWLKLSEAADRLSKSRIFLDDSGSLNVMDVRARCRRLLATEKQLDLIVIDYLQLMSGTRSGKGEASREREISEISRGLKELAKELKVPIIVLSQLNRSVESRQDKRPGLADLRESGAIEQDADMVCFIYRDEVYNEHSEDKGVAEFIVGKNRAGETRTVRLAWIGQYTLFANLAEDSPGAPAGGGPDSAKGDIIL